MFDLDLFVVCYGNVLEHVWRLSVLLFFFFFFFNFSFLLVALILCRHEGLIFNVIGSRCWAVKVISYG